MYVVTEMGKKNVRKLACTEELRVLTKPFSHKYITLGVSALLEREEANSAFNLLLLFLLIDLIFVQYIIPVACGSIGS